MNQNLSDMMATLFLGQVFGRLGLVSKNNEVWRTYEHMCHLHNNRSVKEKV